MNWQDFKDDWWSGLYARYMIYSCLAISVASVILLPLGFDSVLIPISGILACGAGWGFVVRADQGFRYRYFFNFDLENHSRSEVSSFIRNNRMIIGISLDYISDAEYLDDPPRYTSVPLVRLSHLMLLQLKF